MADRNELRAIYLRSGLFCDGEDCYGFSDKGGHPLGNCEDFWKLLEDCYEAGRRYQRFHDTVTCALLAMTSDPCGEVGTAFDCKRAIELGLTPTEAVRRIREGESLDA